MNKKALAVAISGAVAAPMAAQAIDVNVSGQVNRAIMWADDGKQTDVFFVDNTASNSRFRLTGSQDIGRGMMAGFKLEFSAGTNQNASQTIKQSGDKNLVSPITRGSGFNRAIIGRRVNELWFSGNFGKVSLGAGPGSSDGSAEADLSNTWLASESVWTTWGGALTFRTSGSLCQAGTTRSPTPPNTPPGVATVTTTVNRVNGGTACRSGVAMSSVHSNFDGASRYNRLRYDTPSWNGLSASFSSGVNQLWEASAHWDASFAGGDLSTSFGYTNGRGDQNRQYTGSASYLFSQGTSITVSVGNREFRKACAASTAALGGPKQNCTSIPGGRSDARNYYVKLGHQWGNNAISVDYGQTDDLLTNGSSVQRVGFGYVYTVPKPKIELYGSFGWVNLKSLPATYRTSTGVVAGNGSGDFEDMFTVGIGSRIKFD
jgi:predicted porin